VLSFLAPPLVSRLEISKAYFALTAGVIPGLAIFMLNFPLGVHIFNGEKGLGATSGMRGTLQEAWARLPVHRSQVTRGIWAHGMVGGLLFWSMFVSHFLLMMLFAGEWDRLVWFHISMILAIPALAGFLVGGAVGDKFLNAVSILSLIAIPFLDFGVTIGFGAAGHPVHPIIQTAVFIGAPTAASVASYAIARKHLRKPAAPQTVAA
jgi:hypothetical protein